MEKKHGKIVWNVIGIILCVVFGLMLITNVTIIIKGAIDPKTPPSIFGITPMVVQSGSMSLWNDADDHNAGYVIHKVFPEELADIDEASAKALKEGDTVWSYEEDYKVKNEIVGIVDKGEDGMWYNTIRLAEDHIEVGDMIFTKKVDPAKLKVGDVISFVEGSVVVTHRIIGIKTGEDGKLLFTTKGDANLTKDTDPIPEDKIVGLYQKRIAKIGNFAYFLQSPLGMALFIGLPLIAFILYDVIRRQRSANKANAKDAEMEKKTAEMEAELERLRKIAAEKAESEEKSGEE